MTRINESTKITKSDISTFQDWKIRYTYEKDINVTAVATVAVNAYKEGQNGVSLDASRDVKLNRFYSNFQGIDYDEALVTAIRAEINVIIAENTVVTEDDENS